MKKQVILCVDDEHIVLNSLKKQLKLKLENDFMIEIAESGEEAIEILTELIEEGYKVPIVIVDYIMPGMKGDELIKNVRKIAPNTRTILLTGQATVEGVGNAVNQGNLYRFMSKPWNTDDLLLTVNRAFESHTQDQTIRQQNEELAELNASLERKVKNRTLELEEQKKVLQKKNEDITASLAYAKRIQEAMLPSRVAIKKAFPQSFVFFKPKDLVSGDFYWFAKTESQAIYQENHTFKGIERVFGGVSDEKIILAVGDCTGHGVPGAFMSMIGNNILNGIVLQHNITDVSDILHELNKGIRSSLKQEETQNNDGMDIALCAIDLVNRKLEFAGAHNPLVYIQNEELKIIKGDRYPIGGLQTKQEVSFNKHMIDISIPTTFYIFSDGFQDQFGGSENRKFMASRFRKLLFQIHDRKMSEQYQILEETLNNWRGNIHKQVDDILIIGVKL